MALITLTILAELSRRLRKRRTEYEKNDQKTTSSEPQKKKRTVLDEFLYCFDLRSNSGKAMQLESSKSFIPVIAGLRTMVCLWVTLFHVYYYSLYTIKNVPMVFSKLESILLQPIIQSCFYVDVFFVIRYKLL